MVTEEIAPRTDDLDTLPSDRRTAALAWHLARLGTRLDTLESAAQAADPEAVESFGWATFSMDTGLTEAQEDFVTCWSPRAVIKQCQAQRELIEFLLAWVTGTRDDSDELDRVLALIGTFDDALPD